MRNEKGKKMKYEKVEKWMDMTSIATSIVLSVMCATTGSYHEMFAWACTAMWVCIAAMRRNVRDRLYRLSLGRPKEGEVAR